MGKYPCGSCDYLANQRVSLKRHQEVVHENKSYSCTECDFKAKDKNTVIEHEKTVHQGIKEYSCIQRNMQFTKRRNLKSRKLHENIKFSCKLCTFETVCKIWLTEHENAFHDVQRYPCDECKHMSNAKRDLRRHKKSMHEKRKCDECHTIAANNRLYNLHKRQ